MGERRGLRGAFQSVGGDTGTDTEVPERLRGYSGTRTLVTRELVTDFRFGLPAGQPPGEV